MLSRCEVNARIQKEICHETLRMLSDDVLLSQYLQAPSVVLKKRDFANIFQRYGIQTEKISEILEDREFILKYMVPPGAKGTIRGYVFNTIVARELSHILDQYPAEKDRFELTIEKESDDNPTGERPDWHLRDKKTQRCIVGMNQVGLWGGGQQNTRAGKYLKDPRYNTEHRKILCVVAYDKIFTKEKSKDYMRVKNGLEQDTLCFLKNLGPIIKKFFQLDDSIDS